MAAISDTPIADLIARTPALAAVFRAHGLRCPECKGASTDTPHDACANHGKDLRKLIADLEAAISGEGWWSTNGVQEDICP